LTVDTDLVQIDQAHLLHPLYHPTAHQQPKIWVKGEGAFVFDSDGQRYIDGLSALWNVHIGHGRAELAAAAAAQMETLGYFSAYTGSTNLPAIELAHKLSTLFYPQINTFFFTSGGAEATESSFKTARFFWKAVGKPEKVKLISRIKGYHGVTMAAMAATGLPAYWPMFEPRMPGISHIESPYPYRFQTERTDVSPGVAAADLLEAAILREGPETVAAFIAEPVQGAGGVIVPPEDYFPRIRAICDKYEVLLIADEVITGFGRTGRWFGLERYGVQPDIAQFAKGITSGYIPLGGIGVSDEIRDAIDEVPPEKRWMHAFTYSGHPTSCAVALANIAILEHEGLIERADELGARWQEGLRTLHSLAHVGDVRGIGLIAAVELVADKASKAAYPASDNIGVKVGKAMMARGLVTRVVGDAICLAPPLVTPEETLDEIIAIIGAAVAEVTDL
jgi:adenosylmethionine-8-amino-7-oxononanoate aminotransferase